MKKKIPLLLSVIPLLLVCFMPANAEDITANHNDSLLRLFTDKPEFCLYCGELHTGTGGSFVRFFHDIAYFFCGIAGTYPDSGRMWFSYDTIDAGADKPFYFIHAGDNHAHFVSQVTPTLKQYMVATDEGQIFAVK